MFLDNGGISEVLNVIGKSDTPYFKTFAEQVPSGDIDSTTTSEPRQPTQSEIRPGSPTRHQATPKRSNPLSPPRCFPGGQPVQRALGPTQLESCKRPDSVQHAPGKQSHRGTARPAKVRAILGNLLMGGSPQQCNLGILICLQEHVYSRLLPIALLRIIPG